MSNSWNMHQDSSAAAIALVSEVHLLMAERDDFSIDDNGFRSALSAIANNIVVSAPVEVANNYASPYFANSVRSFAPPLRLVAA